MDVWLASRPGRFSPANRRLSGRFKEKNFSQKRIRTLDGPVLFDSRCDRPPGFGYQKRS
jgi:hypothetical protein